MQGTSGWAPTACLIGQQVEQYQVAAGIFTGSGVSGDRGIVDAGFETDRCSAAESHDAAIPGGGDEAAGGGAAGARGPTPGTGGRDGTGSPVASGSISWRIRTVVPSEEYTVSSKIRCPSRYNVTSWGPGSSLSFWNVPSKSSTMPA